MPGQHARNPCPRPRRFDTAHELRHRLMGEAPHLVDPEELDAALLLEDGRQRGLYELPGAAGSSGSGRSPLSTAEFTDSIFEVPPARMHACMHARLAPAAPAAALSFTCPPPSALCAAFLSRGVLLIVHPRCRLAAVTPPQAARAARLLVCGSGRRPSGGGPPAQVHRQCTASLPEEERGLRESALYVVENLGMVRLALQLCDFRDVALSVEAKHVRIDALFYQLPPLVSVPSSCLRSLPCALCPAECGGIALWCAPLGTDMLTSQLWTSADDFL